MKLPRTPYHGSFDVQSLFINTPLDETINLIFNAIFKIQTTFHNMSEAGLKSNLSLACKEGYFIFDNLLYQQIDGVSIGSPLGPTLANIFFISTRKFG